MVCLQDEGQQRKDYEIKFKWEYEHVIMPERIRRELLFGSKKVSNKSNPIQNASTSQLMKESKTKENRSKSVKNRKPTVHIPRRECVCYVDNPFNDLMVIGTKINLQPRPKPKPKYNPNVYSPIFKHAKPTLTQKATLVKVHTNKDPNHFVKPCHERKHSDKELNMKSLEATTHNSLKLNKPNNKTNANSSKKLKNSTIKSKSSGDILPKKTKNSANNDYPDLMVIGTKMTLHPRPKPSKKVRLKPM